MSRPSHCRGSVLRRAARQQVRSDWGRPAWWHRDPGRYAGVGYSNPAVHVQLHLQRQPGSFAASNTTGTPVTVNCTGLPGNTLLIVAQTSPLAGVISPSSAATSEADLTTGTAVTTSATGTLSVTITVTATGGSPGFSALDKKAVCPPTQAQVNAGLTNCVVTVADLATTTGLNFGNIIYPTQPTPHRPTMVLKPATSARAGDADRQRQGRRLPDAGQGQEQVLVGGGPHRGSQPGRRCSRLHHAHTQLASQQHPGGQLAHLLLQGGHGRGLQRAARGHPDRPASERDHHPSPLGPGGPPGSGRPRTQHHARSGQWPKQYGQGRDVRVRHHPYARVLNAPWAESLPGLSDNPADTTTTR